ncbi:MAG: prefoldin subunit beta [Thermoplasmata archaeon]|nr:prefoldin subunit beta [Thermoplasmata archaeon]
MAMRLPQNIENKLVQMKQVEQQLQSVAAQRYQMEIELSEVKHTLEELEKVKEGAPVYRQAGSVLFKVEDRESLVKELEDDREMLEVRIKTLERQEKSLRESYQALQNEISSALQDIPGAGG